MVIYIDVLIFTNIIINYCILATTRKFLHIRISELRVILGAVTGGMCAMSVFLNIESNLLSLLVKLTVTIIMCTIAFAHTDIKQYIKCICATFAFSVMFCGVMILLYQIAKPNNMAIVNDTVYFQVEPAVLIIISITVYIVLIVLQRVLNADVTNTIVSVKMLINGNEYSCIGKIDTGSSVVEPFSGAPVIITEKKLLNNLTPEYPRIIPYKGIDSGGIMYAVKADKVTIDKKEIPKDIYIGIYDGEIDKQIKAIINYQITR